MGNFLEVEKIMLELDDRESNILERDDNDKPIKFKQSKCTCRVYFKNGDKWVIQLEDINIILRLISENEDKKYPYGLGKNMLLLYYILPIWQDYLKKYGFDPPKEDIEKSKRFGGVRKDAS